MRQLATILLLLFSIPVFADVQEECSGYAHLTRIVVKYRMEGASREHVTDIMLLDFNAPPAFIKTIDHLYTIEIPRHPLIDVVIYNETIQECIAVGGPPK